MTTERTAYTPGPWRIEEDPYRHIRSDHGCVWANDYKPDANARLIAKAPTMYVALRSCERILRILSTIPYHRDALAENSGNALADVEDARTEALAALEGIE